MVCDCNVIKVLYFGHLNTDILNMGEREREREREREGERKRSLYSQKLVHTIYVTTHTHAYTHSCIDYSTALMHKA